MGRSNEMTNHSLRMAAMLGAVLCEMPKRDVFL